MTVSEDDLRRAFAAIEVPVDHRPTEDEILALIEGEGDESTRLATLARLVSTPNGRRELDMLRALREGFVTDDSAAMAPVTERPDETVEIEFPTRQAQPLPHWLRPFGLAAAVLIVSVFGITQYTSRTAATSYRSGAAPLALVSPAEGAQLNGEMRFAWRAVAAGASYELEVYSADGRSLARQVTTDTVIVLPRGRAAGDARWWVTAQLEDGTQVRSATRRLVVR